VKRAHILAGTMSEEFLVSLTQDINIFDSARHTLDFEFISQNPDYKKLVTDIDPGDHHWLNFELIEAKKDLFIRGAKAAYHFLIGFDWKNYKSIRKEIAKVCEAEEEISQSSRNTS
jgi:hypothetical protein